MNLLEQPIPWAASVMFRSPAPPDGDRVAERLRAAGCSAAEAGPGAEGGWVVRFAHNHWGEGAACFEPGMKAFKDELLLAQPWLFPDDVRALKMARSRIDIAGEGASGHILRDRKAMLWFARSVMGDEGVAALDAISTHVWTREMLDDEVSHDADADIDAVYIIHNVDNGDGRIWLHTHGLGDVGGTDFDIIDPGEDAQQYCRAIAMRVIEGDLPSDEASMLDFGPGRDVLAVPVEVFNELGRKRDIGVRSDDEMHNIRRLVLCDPHSPLQRRLGWAWGWMTGGRWALRPSRVMSGKRNARLLDYSEAATDILADRAKATLPLLRKLVEEFAKHEPEVAVKLGIKTDDGESREHLWFRVEELGKERVRAALASRPLHVSSMREGDTGEWGLDLLTEWIVATPAGWIKPGSMLPARALRRGIFSDDTD